MSGTVTVATLFANAVTATGAQLDSNFGTVCAYINDPTNRNNYAVGGSATNTVALTFAPPVVGGYTAGLELTWKWGATNTGAVVLNANGLGNVNLVNPDGTALQAGQGVLGSIGKGVYDGTRFIFLAASATPASAAQVSAAATLVPYVSPGTMQNHPGVAKAWASWSGTATGTIAAADSYNVTTIAKLGTGTYAITFATPFANAGYSLVGSSSGARAFVVAGKGAGTATVSILSEAGAPVNVVDVQFVAYGDQ